MKKHNNITFAIPMELWHWLKEYKRKHYVSLSAIFTDLLQEWRSRQDV